MKIDFRVFVDSDVIISSFLSKTGAAYLLTHSKLVAPIVSQYSMQEIKKVCTRLKISMKHTNSAFKNYRQIIIPTDLKIIRTQYKKYTLDENDAHIIAGSVVAKVTFLVTYNLKHYKTEKIKRDFGITILTPAVFLQYTRSK